MHASKTKRSGHVLSIIFGVWLWFLILSKILNGPTSVLVAKIRETLDRHNANEVHIKRKITLKTAVFTTSTIARREPLLR